MIAQRRRAAALVGMTLVGAVLAPMANLWRSTPRDSFPLSHYPMFSARRGSHIDVTFLRGTTATGAHVVLDSRLGATGGMNQERKQIARAARRSRGDHLARRVARRINRRGIHLDVVCVQVVTGSFLLAQYFDETPTVPDSEKVVGTASIPRDAHPKESP